MKVLLNNDFLPPELAQNKCHPLLIPAHNSFPWVRVKSTFILLTVQIQPLKYYLCDLYMSIFRGSGSTLCAFVALSLYLSVCQLLLHKK